MRVSEKRRNRPAVFAAAALLFVLGLLLFLQAADYTLRPDHENTRVRTENFYAEPAGSLDAVFIGSSAAYAFFSPLRLYEKTGLTSAVFATPNQSVSVVRYIIEECRKTQPDAAYVIELRAVLADDEARGNIAVDFRRATDVMPFSKLRDDMIERFVPEEERLSVRFDLVKYHDRWKELRLGDLRLFWGKADPMKGWVFDTNVEPLTELDDFTAVNARLPVDKASGRDLEELLLWCRENGVDARFTVTPFAWSRKQAKIYNTVGDTVKEYGFPWLNLAKEQHAAGIDILRDFSDNRHTNLSGAVKCTDYVAEKLLGDVVPNGKADAAEWERCLEMYRIREREAAGAVLSE